MEEIVLSPRLELLSRGTSHPGCVISTRWRASVALPKNLEAVTLPDSHCIYITKDGTRFEVEGMRVAVRPDSLVMSKGFIDVVDIRRTLRLSRAPLQGIIFHFDALVAPGIRVVTQSSPYALFTNTASANRYIASLTPEELEVRRAAAQSEAAADAAQRSAAGTGKARLTTSTSSRALRGEPSTPSGHNDRLPQIGLAVDDGPEQVTPPPHSPGTSPPTSKEMGVRPSGNFGAGPSIASGDEMLASMAESKLSIVPTSLIDEGQHSLLVVLDADLRNSSFETADWHMWQGNLAAFANENALLVALSTALCTNTPFAPIRLKVFSKDFNSWVLVSSMAASSTRPGMPPNFAVLDRARILIVTAYVGPGLSGVQSPSPPAPPSPAPPPPPLNALALLEGLELSQGDASQLDVSQWESMPLTVVPNFSQHESGLTSALLNSLASGRMPREAPNQDPDALELAVVEVLPTLATLDASGKSLIGWSMKVKAMRISAALVGPLAITSVVDSVTLVFGSRRFDVSADSNAATMVRGGPLNIALVLSQDVVLEQAEHFAETLTPSHASSSGKPMLFPPPVAACIPFYVEVAVVVANRSSLGEHFTQRCVRSEPRIFTLYGRLWGQLHMPSPGDKRSRFSDDSDGSDGSNDGSRRSRKSSKSSKYFRAPLHNTSHDDSAAASSMAGGSFGGSNSSPGSSWASGTGYRFSFDYGLGGAATALPLRHVHLGQLVWLATAATPPNVESQTMLDALAPQHWTLPALVDAVVTLIRSGGAPAAYALLARSGSASAAITARGLVTGKTLLEAACSRGVEPKVLAALIALASAEAHTALGPPVARFLGLALELCARSGNTPSLRVVVNTAVSLGVDMVDVDPEAALDAAHSTFVYCYLWLAVHARDGIGASDSATLEFLVKWRNESELAAYDHQPICNTLSSYSSTCSDGIELIDLGVDTVVCGSLASRSTLALPAQSLPHSGVLRLGVRHRSRSRSVSTSRSRSNSFIQHRPRQASQCEPWIPESTPMAHFVQASSEDDGEDGLFTCKEESLEDVRECSRLPRRMLILLILGAVLALGLLTAAAFITGIMVGGSLQQAATAPLRSSLAAASLASNITTSPHPNGTHATVATRSHGDSGFDPFAASDHVPVNAARKAYAIDRIRARGRIVCGFTFDPTQSVANGTMYDHPYAASPGPLMVSNPAELLAAEVPFSGVTHVGGLRVCRGLAALILGDAKAIEVVDAAHPEPDVVFGSLDLLPYAPSMVHASPPMFLDAIGLLIRCTNAGTCRESVLKSVSHWDDRVCVTAEHEHLVETYLPFVKTNDVVVVDSVVAGVLLLEDKSEVCRSIIGPVSTMTGTLSAAVEGSLYRFGHSALFPDDSTPVVMSEHFKFGWPLLSLQVVPYAAYSVFPADTRWSQLLDSVVSVLHRAGARGIELSSSTCNLCGSGVCVCDPSSPAENAVPMWEEISNTQGLDLYTDYGFSELDTRATAILVEAIGTRVGVWTAVFGNSTWDMLANQTNSLNNDWSAGGGIGVPSSHARPPSAAVVADPRYLLGPAVGKPLIDTVPPPPPPPAPVEAEVEVTQVIAAFRTEVATVAERVDREAETRLETRNTSAGISLAVVLTVLVAVVGLGAAAGYSAMWQPHRASRGDDALQPAPLAEWTTTVINLGHSPSEAVSASSTHS
ncbi:uncharacterized protein AMSG_01368 [Thecamonas trahens ATCC 50062]|uniref:Uncharacterized protein n=1 Tax=Thecamonas trahens ATCC 50062 TaxID=461836 RepID=A0A0L0DMX8_THETB|nr:hypothetical protein AMSG_01368 [Thecamonas trahens ATCC 50062]KNC53659.1 hypothetical protein AMSG_01368 [Thecamonas trahens ATCC 50062]|eukprot:XP_013761974.1 hypothetical protein AMSG_01368 [Thecamonas trahens ATCC 50062]